MTEIHKPISLAEFKKQRGSVRDVNKEVSRQMSGMDMFASWITCRVGTIDFFIFIVVWTILWIGWNFLAPPELQFDRPMGFVFWLFISNLIQILLMPLIMVGQNIQGRHSEVRAQNDLEVNIKAEQEIETILQHLEYQNAILIAMMKKLGVGLDGAESKLHSNKD
jgi:hypothetical protein